MKKRLLFLSMLLSTTFATRAQVAFGVKAGYNLASERFGYTAMPFGYEQGVTYISGFHAGLIADWTLCRNFSVQPGLFYSTKGSKYNTYLPGPADGPEPATGLLRLNYLELPVNFLYRYQLGAGSLFGGLGPYLAYGLTGKATITHDTNPEYERKYKVRFKDKAPDNSGRHYVKPWDAGINFTLGYEFKNGILCSINYSLGLTDISPVSQMKEKNHYFGISAGYLFRH